MNELDLMEKTLSSEPLYDGKILHLYRDQVQLPNGRQAVREIIRHVGAVCVVPLLDDGRVIMERQYRYPINQVITEIPAGKLDSPDEDPLAAAKRELREETGYEASGWLMLGQFVPAAAYCDEMISMYLARGLTAGTQKLDEDEFLNVTAIPLDQLIEQVMQGKITDAKTQTALLKTYVLLKQESK